MSQESATEYSSTGSCSCHEVAERGRTGVAGTAVLRINKITSTGELTGTLGSASGNVIIAVGRLHAIGEDVEKFLRDDTLTQELETCFNDVLLFFERETIRLLYELEDQSLVDCITCIFNADFLKILLDIRSQILRAASGDGPYCADGMVICSVDKILARFWDFILSIACFERILKKQGDDELPLVSNHKEEDNLRVASQLPLSWQQFPELLRSEYASPASKRLALCILFASFVIKPDLDNCDPWTSSCLNPGHIIKCLQPLLEQYVIQARTLDLSGHNYAALPLKTAYAMAIALYSSAEAARQRQEAEYSAPFQPYTLACLLELIQYIFPRTAEVPLVLDGLDNAQTVLLRWGNIAAWAWEKWGDPRVIGFDAVVSMSANWLCRFDESLSVALWTNDDAYRVNDNLSPSGSLQFLRAVLRIKPRSSLIALFRQVCDESNRLVIPDERLNCVRLHRSVWGIAELIENCTDTLPSDDISIVAEHLIIFFAELAENNSSEATRVKVEINRALKSLKREAAKKVLCSLQKNVSFFSKIAAVIANTSRMITKDETDGFLLDPGISGGLAALLDLISLFYEHDANRCIPVTAFQLLSDLIKLLLRRIGTLALRRALLNCVSYAYAQCQTGRHGERSEKNPQNVRPESNEGSPAVKIHKTWEDDGAFCLALDVNCGDLGLAAVFASYVSLSVKKTMDPLLVAEAWDYLRDTLLLFLSGYLEKKDCGRLSCREGNDISEPDGPFPEPTSRNGGADIANATVEICTALETMLRRCDTVVVRLLLESPLTNSLYISLESLVKAEKGGNLDGNARADGADRSQSTGDEINLRIVRTCEKFLKKLKRIEADLNKSS